MTAYSSLPLVGWRAALVILFVLFLPLLSAQAQIKQDPGPVEQQIASLSANCDEKATDEGLVPDKKEFWALAELFLRTDGANWTDHTNWLNGCNSKAFGYWAGVTVVNGDVVAINLPSNQLSGRLSNSMGRLKQLQSLNLSNNGLRELLPDSLAYLPQLAALNLTGNKLTGSLPPYLGTYPALETVDLADNQLSGTIPFRLFNAASLRRLDLAHNELSGVLPATLSGCATLTCLQLADNKNLSGELPTSWSALKSLDTLDLSGNRFSGTVPAQLATREALTFLQLNDNRFRHCPDFTTLPVIERVNLADNGFDFGSLEPLFSGPGQAKLPLTVADDRFFYQNQTIATAPVRRTQTIDEPLTIALTMGGAHNQYQWEKYDGTGWQALTVPSAATDRLTITQPNIGFDAGTYRCSITNTWVTDVKLYSPETTIELLASTRIQVGAVVDPTENDT